MTTSLVISVWIWLDHTQTPLMTVLPTAAHIVDLDRSSGAQLLLMLVGKALGDGDIDLDCICASHDEEL